MARTADALEPRSHHSHKIYMRPVIFSNHSLPQSSTYRKRKIIFTTRRTMTHDDDNNNNNSNNIIIVMQASSSSSGNQRRQAPAAMTRFLPPSNTGASRRNDRHNNNSVASNFRRPIEEEAQMASEAFAGAMIRRLDPRLFPRHAPQEHDDEVSNANDLLFASSSKSLPAPQRRKRAILLIDMALKLAAEDLFEEDVPVSKQF